MVLIVDFEVPSDELAFWLGLSPMPEVVFSGMVTEVLARFVLVLLIGAELVDALNEMVVLFRVLELEYNFLVVEVSFQVKTDPEQFLFDENTMFVLNLSE